MASAEAFPSRCRGSCRRPSRTRGSPRTQWDPPSPRLGRTAVRWLEWVSYCPGPPRSAWRAPTSFWPPWRPSSFCVSSYRQYKHAVYQYGDPTRPDLNGIPSTMIALGLLLVLAQTPDTLLASVRSLSGAVPGDLPTAVGYLSFADDSGTIGNAVDGAGKIRVLSSNPVFQVRFPHGYIMVDAGMDQASMRKGRPFDAANYAEIQTALEGANLIVITHEHIDHVETLVKSSIADKVAPHT